MKQLLLISFILVFISCNKEIKKEVGFSGEDISQNVSIIRDKDTKKAIFNINIDTPWALYAGNSVENIDLQHPVSQGTTKGNYPINVNDTARSYFQLITAKGNAILSEQHLPMSGGYNFRDLGGIKTTDGKYVKWGKVLRSDDLYKLTDADLNYLASIPLITIVDFRAQSEIDDAPDRIPSSVKTDYACLITPGRLNSFDLIRGLTTQQMDSAMMDMNRLFVTDSTIINQYRAYFDLLQNEKNIPLMFHCSAGKDRTGMGAALFLYSLGVDEEVIMNDYLLSNRYLSNKYASLVTEYPTMKPLFVVKPDFLKAGIEQIKREHGSIENYLTKVLHVNIKKMRKLYLY